VKRKKKLMILVSTLLLIVGVFFILKPIIGNKQNIVKQNEILLAIEGGEQSVSIELAKYESENDYYSSNSEDALITPLPIKSPNEESISEFDGLGVLEIESIDLKLPIVEGVESAALEVAVCHLTESTNIGQEGNCIIVGHRNYTYGEMFNRLDELNAGDKIFITTNAGITYEYRVYATTVVEPGSDKLFECEDEQYKLTFLTCTPVRTATHRLLVIAELAE
jgi:sortase A